MKHAPEVEVSQPPHCTTRSTAKRKRSDDTVFTNMEQTTYKNESSTDSDYKIHENSGKIKKMKYSVRIDNE